MHIVLQLRPGYLSMANQITAINALKNKNRKNII